MARAKNEVSLILKELKAIKKDLAYIKEHMIDVDSILTEEDLLILKEAREEFKAGKTIKLSELESDFE